MAYVTVPKDLTHVKSKVLFGLTKRQRVCFGGALLTGGPLYFLARNYLCCPLSLNAQRLK